MNKPTEPGWYWVEFANGDEDEIVRVVEHEGRLRFYMVETDCGFDVEDDQLIEKWIGPLSKPQEAA